MASPADGFDRGNLFLAPGALVALLVLAAAAVVFLPGIGDNLPHPGQDAHARYAAGGAGVLGITAAFVYLVSKRLGLDRLWIAEMLVFVTALVLVKFILSPDAFQRSEGTGLAEFLVAGLVVLPLYVVGLVVIHAAAARHPDTWNMWSRLGVAMGLAIAAVAVRFIVALVLGTASRYASDFLGAGLIMPVVVIGGSLALMDSFHRAGARKRVAMNMSVAIVVAHHVLWLPYMLGLFG